MLVFQIDLTFFKTSMYCCFFIAQEFKENIISVWTIDLIMQILSYLAVVSVLSLSASRLNGSSLSGDSYQKQGQQQETEKIQNKYEGSTHHQIYKLLCDIYRRQGILQMINCRKNITKRLGKIKGKTGRSGTPGMLCTCPSRL